MRAVLLAFTLGLVAAPVWAGRCGSDVDGHGAVVPCACGDVLVSSHTLSPADPITHQPCVGEGLLVAIPAASQGATLAFGGQALSGSMQGVGLHIVSGGQGGLTVTGPGAIGGFDTGVTARRGSLAALTGLLAIGNAADGFALDGDGFALRSSAANRNGRDGFVLRGAGFRLEDTHAEQNGRYGFAVTGHGAVIAPGNIAMGNGRDGFMIRGQDVTVTEPTATANAGRGVRAQITRGALRDPRVADNGEDRIPRCTRQGSCR